MTREIERTFLVEEDSWKASAGPGAYIEQTYLHAYGADAQGESSGLEARVERTPAGSTMRVRHGFGESREESTFSISDFMAAEALKGPNEGVLTKTRYQVPVGDTVFDVDVYGARHQDMVLARVRLPDEETPFPRPDWLGAELTGRPGWSGRELGREEPHKAVDKRSRAP